jgi:hypothetical protein
MPMKIPFLAFIFLLLLTSFGPTDTKNRMIFPDFTQGTVTFKNGTSTAALLNYDSYEEEMIFNDKGKIMAVALPETILKITIKDRTFEWLEGDVFLEKVDSAGVVLYKRNRNKLMSQGKGMPFGGTSSSSAVQTVSSVPLGHDKQAKELTIDEQFKLVPDNLYYAKSGVNFNLLSSTKQIAKVFDADKKEIETYINSQKLDLQKFDDLIQVIHHCKKED